MKIALDISEELATQLQSIEESLPKILELGVRKVINRSQAKFEGVTEVLEFFAQIPSPEEMIALRASEALQDRIRELLDKNRTVGLTEDEEAEWSQYEYIEHLIRMAKAKALAKLKSES
ncbi:hypothetical protein IQ250_01885 [Pseudanabaenaceae cyanobacterium LEGE 13415]|nr:hypothetical protein [Pseudanabaenaceae cyanobacterium LEGE 13415]